MKVIDPTPKGGGFQRHAFGEFSFKFLPNVLELSNCKLKESNINIYKWYRLDYNGYMIVDWLLVIEVHPNVKEKNIMKVKQKTMYKIIDIIKEIKKED